MIETLNAALNQQGQLASDQHASIGGWLTSRQLRAAPSLLPFAAIVALVVFAGGVLESRGLGLTDITASARLGDTPVSIPVVPTVVVIVVAIAALYALAGLRRILAYGAARAALAAPQLQQSQGTVVRHGGEHIAVLADGRTWNLNVSRNVCSEVRQLAPGAFTFYSLRLQVPRARDRQPQGGDGAWLVSAQPLRSAGALEPALLQTLAATNGFVVEALSDNRAGRLTPLQAKALASSFRGKTWRTFWLGIAAIAVGGVVWYPTDGQDPGAAWVGLGLAGVGVLVVLYGLGPGRRRQSADLSNAAVVAYEGPIRAIQTLGHDGGSSSFFYEAGDRRYSVSARAFEALDERYRYRLFYLPRTRQIVNIEPLDRGAAPLDVAAFSSRQAPLTAAEISHAMGQPVGEPTFRELGSIGFWSHPVGNDRVTVAIIQSGVGGPLPIPFLTGGLRRGQTVADLGDEAFFDSRRLVVRTGSTYLAIDAQADLSVMITLGRQALARLNATPRA